MSKQLLQQALDALEIFLFTPGYQIETEEYKQADKTLGALRVAIAAPSPEPVGHIYTIAGVQHCTIEKVLEDGPLYASPIETESLRKELERVTLCLKKANDSHEEFERKWYLSCQELEEVKAQRDAMALDAARFDFMEREAKKEGMIPEDGDLRKQVDVAMAAQVKKHDAS